MGSLLSGQLNVVLEVINVGGLCRGKALSPSICSFRKLKVKSQYRRGW